MQEDKAKEELNEHRWNIKAKLDFFGLTFEDVAPLADELGLHWTGLAKSPQPPAASPLWAEFSVILFIFSPFVASFFAELGKDTYKGFRQLLRAVAKKAEHIRDRRGCGYTVGFEINEADSYSIFAFIRIPEEQTLANALQQIPSVLNNLPKNKHVLAIFDADKGTWRCEEASPEIEAEFKWLR
ncbi:MAG: hypothetical protein HY664_02865, partial [Chloroflexi bacterium]|nr:hypothetical protein [Chloroflexota bacterium]